MHNNTPEVALMTLHVEHWVCLQMTGSLMAPCFVAGCVVCAGGRCLAAARAAKLLKLLGAEAEMVTVDVAHDSSE